MSNFSIEIREDRNIKILNLSGYLDAHNSNELEDQLKELIDGGFTRIVVNFSNLNYIASAGLGVFMAYIEDVREQSGDIKLCEMTDKVYTVFDLLGFPVLYDITRSELEAIEKFKV